MPSSVGSMMADLEGQCKNSNLMHEHLQIPRAKILGRLETRDGILIAIGGAEFNEDASGFFLTERGIDMVPILPGQSAQISSALTEVISVWDLKVAAPTASLPRRYTFRHGATKEACPAPVETALSARRKSSKPANSRSKAPQQAPSMAIFGAARASELKKGLIS